MGIRTVHEILEHERAMKHANKRANALGAELRRLGLVASYAEGITRVAEFLNFEGRRAMRDYMDIGLNEAKQLSMTFKRLDPSELEEFVKREASMEKKFFIDKIKNPRTRDEKLEVLGALSSLSVANQLKKEGTLNATDNLVAKGILYAAHEMMGWKDFNVETDIIGLERYLNMPKKIRSHYCRAVSYAYYSKPEYFVFQKEFFKVLRRAKLKNLDWSMFNFKGEKHYCFRFPEPILYEGMDNEGDPVMLTEGFVALVTIDGRPELAYIFYGYRAADPSSFLKMCIVVPRPETGPVKLASDSPSDQMIGFILKSIIYIESGNPDLREFRNPIRYQSPTSKTPVRAHKEFTELPFNVIGFNWLKERQAFVDSWGVEPFIRLQPVGPGRQEYKYVCVRAHTRRRHRKEVTITSPTVSVEMAEAHT